MGPATRNAAVFLFVLFKLTNICMKTTEICVVCKTGLTETIKSEQNKDYIGWKGSNRTIFIDTLIE